MTFKMFDQENLVLIKDINSIHNIVETEVATNIVKYSYKRIKGRFTL